MRDVIVGARQPAKVFDDTQFMAGSLAKLLSDRPTCRLTSEWFCAPFCAQVALRCTKHVSATG
jgi:hypothetical protein